MASKRRRRTKEEARDEILRAAAKRLLDDGPDALRIADVAKDVGMSHPTLLHHAGSREELVQAATSFLMQRSAERTLEAMQRVGAEKDMHGFVRSSLMAFSDVGRTRAAAWLALTNRFSATPRPPWEPFIDAAKAIRDKRNAQRCERGVTNVEAVRPSPEPATDPDENIRASLVLAFLAVFALDLLGEEVLEDAGLGPGPQATDKFITWLARLLHETIDR